MRTFSFQILPIYFIAVFFLFQGCKSPDEVGGCTPSLSLDAYQLVWSDEFDGTEIDDSKWSFDLADGCQLGPNLCGWGNNELQYYTDRPENARISDGNLIITAQQETPAYLGEHDYTSARMITRDKGDWRYGRIDVRAKMPIGQGLWGAIWMLPTDTVYGGWPRSGEIDIMEYLGNEPNKMFSTIHYGHDFWRFTSQELFLSSGDFHNEFHTFTCIWTEACLTFYVDGVKVGTGYSPTTTLPTTWPFDQDFHLLLNLAVGGNLPGNPDGTTTFPQQMEIDYVRVYEEK